LRGLAHKLIVFSMFIVYFYLLARLDFVVINAAGWRYIEHYHFWLNAVTLFPFVICAAIYLIHGYFIFSGKTVLAGYMLWVSLLEDIFFMFQLPPNIHPGWLYWDGMKPNHWSWLWLPKLFGWKTVSTAFVFSWCALWFVLSVLVWFVDIGPLSRIEVKLRGRLGFSSCRC